MARTRAGSRWPGGGQRLLEDCGERGAGVFDVGVDAAAGEGLLADVAAGEVEAAVDSLGMAFGGVDGFDFLGEEFAEDDLLGEVLGADDDARGARRSTGEVKSSRRQQVSESASWRCFHPCQPGDHPLPPPPHRLLHDQETKGLNAYDLGSKRLTGKPFLSLELFSMIFTL